MFMKLSQQQKKTSVEAIILDNYTLARATAYIYPFTNVYFALFLHERKQ